MPRLFINAGLLTGAVACSTSASVDATCVEEGIRRSELDESSMLQQIISQVVVSADTSARATSAREVLADARHLADSIKENNPDVANITLAAKQYTIMMETELLPNLNLALAEMRQSFLAQSSQQRQAAQQCDAQLVGSATSAAVRLSSFDESKAAVVACDALVEKQRIALETAQEANASETELAKFAAFHAAKANECTFLRASADTAACDRASYVHGTYAAYATCRADVAIANEEAAQSAKNQADDHRTQLLEASQAQCIARVLVTPGGHAEIMQERLDECDQLSSAASAQNSPDDYGDDVLSLPPMLVCQDVVVHSCTDGHVELDVGDSSTWLAPCRTCPAMVLEANTPPPGLEHHWDSSLKSWLTTAATKAADTFNFGYRHSPTLNLVHFYGQSDSTSSSSSSVRSWLYSQSDVISSSTSALRSLLYGKFHATSSESHTGQYIALFLAIPLASMGVALCVAVALNGPPSRQGNDASEGKMGSLMGRRGSGSGVPSVRSLGGRGHEFDHSYDRPSYGHGGPKMPSPQHSFGHGHGQHSFGHGHGHEKGSPVASQRNSLESMERPSTGSSHNMATGRALYTRQSLPPMSGQQHGLCPELMVPEGSECILAIPSLAAAAPGEVTLKNITDKTGEALLYVGITSAPKGGEYVLLAKKDQQELAFCELGAAMRAEGWSGKIFRWDGEIYARLREERPSEGMARNSMGPSAGMPMGGNTKSFLVIAAGEPYWELRVTGSLQDRKLSVEDGSRQVVAMVSPGEELGNGRPSQEFYKLRLGPNADSCTVIVALMAIERLLSQQAPEGVPRSNSRGVGSI